MNQELTDQRATITRITQGPLITSIGLQWGGPADRHVTDFNLSQLGSVQGHGGCFQTGWVVLDGPCLLREGESIPLLKPTEPEPIPVNPETFAEVAAVVGTHLAEVMLGCSKPEPEPSPVEYPALLVRTIDGKPFSVDILRDDSDSWGEGYPFHAEGVLTHIIPLADVLRVRAMREFVEAFIYWREHASLITEASLGVLELQAREALKGASRP